MSGSATSSDNESIDEAQVERILQERKLARLAQQEEQKLLEQAQQELVEEKQFTKEDIERMVDQADNVKSMIDAQAMTDKDFQKILSEIESILQQNLDLRTTSKDPSKFLDIEMDLHSKVHELQGVTAYPEKMVGFVENGLVLTMLQVMQHPNVDVAQLALTVLYELTEEDSPVATKVVAQLVENSVWTLVLKLCLMAMTDIKDSSEQSLFQQKALQFMTNLVSLEPQQVSNKMMASDNFIDFLLLQTEQVFEDEEPEAKAIAISNLAIELVAQILGSCAEDWRMKFAITLQGVKRLVEINKRVINLEQDSGSLINQLMSIAESSLDALALLLVQTESSENADLFMQCGGYETMLTCMLRWDHLRKDALKVICYGLTQATSSGQDIGISHVVYLIEETRALSIMFGFWGQQPSKVKVMSEELNMLQERCLSVFWNLLRPLHTQHDKHVKALLCLERILFKFLENKQEKVKRLCTLFKAFYERISDFDLSEFSSPSELHQLETHFNLDILVLISQLLTSFMQSETCKKLLKTQQIPENLMELRISKQLGQDGINQMSDLLQLNTKRYASDSEFSKLTQTQVDYLKTINQ